MSGIWTIYHQGAYVDKHAVSKKFEPVHLIGIVKYQAERHTIIVGRAITVINHLLYPAAKYGLHAVNQLSDTVQSGTVKAYQFDSVIVFVFPYAETYRVHRMRVDIATSVGIATE